LAVDIDPRNGGNESLAELERQHGALATPATVSTGGGGQHRLFRHPGGHIPHELAPGIDLKSDGGYIVAAPSLHKSGRRYRWESASIPKVAELPDLPVWALEALSRKPDLRQAPPRTKKPSANVAGTRDRTCRHWWMINELSHYGIRKVRYYSSLSELTAKLQADSRKIESWLRSPKGPLPDDEIVKLVKQSATFVWKHRFDEKRNRFAMKLAPRVWIESRHEYLSDVRHRQQQGGRYAAEQRTLKTRAKIERAVEELLVEGSRVTAVTIAERTKLGRATVYRHSDMWQRSFPERRSAPASEPAIDAAEKHDSYLVQASAACDEVLASLPAMRLASAVVQPDSLCSAGARDLDNPDPVIRAGLTSSPRAEPARYRETTRRIHRRAGFSASIPCNASKRREQRAPPMAR
jgi:hypothetical protein